MNLLYEGCDMTQYVNVTKCVCRDVSCGRADSMELEVDHAAAWARWKPQEDDVIIAGLDDYSTGRMYLNAVVPEGDRFRMLATALPSASRRKAWGVFRDMTLADILHQCAAEIGMEAKLYGTSGNIKYPFLMRENEGCAAFMNRLCKYEGIALKALNGAFRAISIDYAQGLPVVSSLWLDPDKEGVEHRRQAGKKISTLTILSPNAKVSATDSAATYGNAATISNLPIADKVQAGRWARGLLMAINRRAETLRVTGGFQPTITAMTRVNVDGSNQTFGEWLVDEAEHDLVNATTTTNMLRVITTIQ